MSNLLSSTIQAPKTLAKSFRNWARLKEWERKSIRQRLPFSSRLGDEITEKLRARGKRRRFNGYRDVLKGFSKGATTVIIWDAPQPAEVSHLRNRVMADMKTRLFAKIELPGAA